MEYSNIYKCCNGNFHSLWLILWKWANDFPKQTVVCSKSQCLQYISQVSGHLNTQTHGDSVKCVAWDVLLILTSWHSRSVTGHSVERQDWSTAGDTDPKCWDPMVVAAVGSTTHSLQHHKHKLTANTPREQTEDKR